MFDRLHKTYLSISYKGSIIVFIMLIFIFSKTFLINNQFSSYPKMTICFSVHNSLSHYRSWHESPCNVAFNLNLGPQLGNQRGTLLKQADQHRTGPYWAEMLAISEENVGRIWDPYGEPTWDPYENGGQKPYGLLIWALYSCPYGSHVGPRFCASWVHLKIVV